VGLAPWTPKPASLPIVEAIDDVLDEYVNRRLTADDQGARFDGTNYA
jgi:hypothetical protein